MRCPMYSDVQMQWPPIEVISVGGVNCTARQLLFLHIHYTHLTSKQCKSMNTIGLIMHTTLLHATDGQ